MAQHDTSTPLPDTNDGVRIAYANQPERNVGFVDNVVITSQYTAWNFVPLFLFHQFSRFANFYFLVVSVLQMVPAITITNGIPYSLAPLSFVLFFDAIVTAQEDYNRHKADDHDNGKPCSAVRDGSVQRVAWRDLRVGDMVKVQRGQVLPADIVFLCAVSDDGEASDVCYVQTAQLDGETNLKLRSTLQETVAAIQSDSQASGFRGHVECEAPNEFFDKFTGVVQLDSDSTPNPRRLPLEADNVLLRGCVLRNVQYVYGIIVYTGKETKVRVKQQVRSMKTASVESVINFNIALLMGCLVVACTVGAVAWAVYTNDEGVTHWYLAMENVTFLTFIGKIFTFFLLNASCIPVSLYVSMKMARTAQKFFMEQDCRMYHEEPQVVEATGGKEGHFPMRVRSMDLNDELGRIGYVFSDKTGTLTLNYMQFRKLLVQGVSYGLGTTQIGRDRMRRLGLLEGNDDGAESDDDVPIVRPGPGRTEVIDKNGRRMVPHVTFNDGSETHPGRSIFRDLNSSSPVQQHLHRFMLHLVLNHTVIPETLRDDDGNVTGMQLSASSPDEEAFVYAGEYFGYTFKQRRGAIVTIDVQGQLCAFKVLYILAYNQRRKRMSVIVEEENGDAWLYAKGADTVIYERLRDSRDEEERQAKLTTTKNLCDWGNDGLRTLVFACRKLGRDELDSWAERYEAARSSMVELNKRKNKQPNAIDDLMEEMESNLMLQGATANEDRLQPQVPETIALFAEAGINLWMLTGDKQETAINIGFATKLITDTMEQMVYTTDEMELPRIVQLLKEKAAAVAELTKRGEIPSPAWALVINEKALDYTLEHCAQELMEVARACKAVICCRARPDQKGKMVALIKAGCPGTRTLAVGDGANDVDMIKEAHVGVGIAGAEGVQAANASDFSIGRFKFLQRLLLVHGRWNYRRMSKLVCYMFYKNICMVLTQLLYSIYTGFSGQKFYIELMAQNFNLMYTGLPILYLAVLDRDISDENCLRFPMVYADGPLGRRLNKRVFWSWVLSGVIEACILLFVTMWAFDVPDYHGSPYVFQLGLVCFCGVVFATTMRVAVEHHTHHWSFVILLGLCCFSVFPSVLIFGVFNADNTDGQSAAVFSSPAFWFLLPMLVFLTSIRVGVVKIYRRYFQTELRHVVKEAQQLTRRYSALDRWSTAAFKAALAGKHYDGTIPPKPKNKAKVAAMRPVAWGGDAESAERQRTKAALLSPTRAVPTSSASEPVLVATQLGTPRLGEETKAPAPERAQGMKATKSHESARALWSSLRAAHHIAFNNMYTGFGYSEDPRSTERLVGRFASGHTRLRSHATAPPGLWAKEARSQRSVASPAAKTMPR